MPKFIPHICTSGAPGLAWGWGGLGSLNCSKSVKLDRYATVGDEWLKLPQSHFRGVRGHEGMES